MGLPMHHSVSAEQAAMAGPHPNVRKRASDMPLPSTRRWITADSPPEGLPARPTASGLSSVPTLRGLRKWSITTGE